MHTLLKPHLVRNQQNVEYGTWCEINKMLKYGTWCEINKMLKYGTWCEIN
jgi:hypothetical protein